MAEEQSKPPGYAFFVVNDGINEGLFEGAVGSHVDMDYFQAIFENQLEFQLVNNQTLNRNLTFAQWDHTKVENEDRNRPVHAGQCCLMCLLRSLDFTDIEYLMIGISTHGKDVEGDAMIQLFDGTFLYVDDIMYSLSDEKIPALSGKKRILVFSSCRTEASQAEKAVDRGAAVDVDVDGLTNTLLEESQHTQPLAIRTDSQSSVSLRPRRLERMYSLNTTSNVTQLKDFLIVYAAPPGRTAKTNSKDGSWMLQALMNAVMEHDFDRPLNLFHALTKAASIMSERETVHSTDPLECGQKNIVFFTSTLATMPIFTRSNGQERLNQKTPDLVFAGNAAVGGYMPLDLPRHSSIHGEEVGNADQRTDQTQPKML